MRRIPTLASWRKKSRPYPNPREEEGEGGSTEKLIQMAAHQLSFGITELEVAQALIHVGATNATAFLAVRAAKCLRKPLKT